MTECADWLTNLSKYVANLNTELVKIKAENAELLRELDLTKRMYAKVSEEKCVADSENAKLRELVQDMHGYFHLTKVQGLCQWGPSIMRRIRDLGIDVSK